jgi:cell division protein FtsZ
METTCVTTTAQEKGSFAATRTKLAVKVIGAGGAGVSIVEALMCEGFPSESCAVLHADAEMLAHAGAGEKIKLPSCSQRGDTTSGESALPEDVVTRLRGFCSGAQVVCLVAGLGGRTGTDVGAMIAQEAKAAGASILAFVTLPFECEGSLRQARALWGLEQLRAHVDGILCLPNQKLFQSITENTRLSDTFGLPTKLLAEAFPTGSIQGPPRGHHFAAPG